MEPPAGSASASFCGGSPDATYKKVNNTAKEAAAHSSWGRGEGSEASPNRAEAPATADSKDGEWEAAAQSCSSWMDLPLRGVSTVHSWMDQPTSVSYTLQARTPPD
jgi:hypothetical protein